MFEYWSHFTPRHAPEISLEGHLTFALKYEGVDLAVLKKLFTIVDSEEMERIVAATPTGSYVSRFWFLYEWLTGTNLNLPNLGTGNYISILDQEKQCSLPGEKISRHRIINNLPGTREFCPLLFRTSHLCDIE